MLLIEIIFGLIIFKREKNNKIDKGKLFMKSNMKTIFMTKKQKIKIILFMYEYVLEFLINFYFFVLFFFFWDWSSSSGLNQGAWPLLGLFVE